MMGNQKKPIKLISLNESLQKEISLFSDGEKRLFLIAFLKSTKPNFVGEIDLSVDEWRFFGGHDNKDMTTAVNALFGRDLQYQEQQVVNSIDDIWECLSRIISGYAIVDSDQCPSEISIKFNITPCISKFFQENSHKIHEVELNKSVVAEYTF